MLELTRGNLLDATVEALVNPVNTVGVMGKGLALQLREAFPENFAAYQRECEAGRLVPGRVFVFERHAPTGPRFLINFPTKRHWRQPSRYEDIDAGLEDLVAQVRARGIRSLAVPALGCGLGGLDWERVRPMVEDAFRALPEVRVLLFAPEGPAGPRR